MPHSGSETSSTRDSSPKAKLIPVQLSMFDLETWWHSNNAISLPASEAGAVPSVSPASQTLSLFGPAPAPASPSRSRASRKVLPTNATSGLSGESLSASDALQRSMESRLRQLLNGSDLCEVIWKPWATPWGQSLARPRARVRTISETDFGSWATPSVKGNYNRKGLSEKSGDGLATQVLMASPWATPAARDWRSDRSQKSSEEMYGMKGRPLPRQAIEAMPWPTPTAEQYGSNQGGAAGRVGPVRGSIATIAKSVWPTAKSSDDRIGMADRYKGPMSSNGRRSNLNDAAAMQASNGSSEPTEKRGALNPEFVCWLMGYPPEWLSCAPSAMPSTSGRRRRSSEQRCET